MKRILSACLVKAPTPRLRMTDNRDAFGVVCKPDKGSAVCFIYTNNWFIAAFFFLFSTAKLWNFCLGTNPSGKQHCDNLLPPVCSMSLLFAKKFKSQFCLLCPCEVCYCRKDKLMSIPAYFTFIGNWKDILQYKYRY